MYQTPLTQENQNVSAIHGHSFNAMTVTALVSVIAAIGTMTAVIEVTKQAARTSAPRLNSFVITETASTPTTSAMVIMTAETEVTKIFVVKASRSLQQQQLLPDLERVTAVNSSSVIAEIVSI